MREALLLLGPTGVGKSPLGDLLEEEGLRGRMCRHLDFGRRLRDVAAGLLRPPGFEDAWVNEVRVALETGALLTDAQFPIAAAILDNFLRRDPRGTTALAILNGLPRHESQARAVSRTVDVRWVVRLAADPDVLRERIRTDAGRDRVGRPDDDPDAVEARIERFRARTLPLVEYYRGLGALVTDIPVLSTTTAADARQILECVGGRGVSANNGPHGA